MLVCQRVPEGDDPHIFPRWVDGKDHLTTPLVENFDRWAPINSLGQSLGSKSWPTGNRLNLIPKCEDKSSKKNLRQVAKTKTALGNFVVVFFPARGKAHKLHFSGFKNISSSEKGCCLEDSVRFKGMCACFMRLSYFFENKNRISSNELKTRSCTARAVAISFTVWWKSRTRSLQGVWMMMMMIMWAMKKDNCKITGSKLVDIQYISILLMAEIIHHLMCKHMFIIYASLYHLQYPKNRCGALTINTTGLY